MNKLISYIVLLFIGIVGYAQETILFDTSTSTINADEVVVDKAPRVYSQAKSNLNLKDTIKRPVSFDFDYTPDVNLSPLKTTVAIYRLKIKQEDKSKAGFVRAGAGNFGSTLLDAYYGSRANNKWSYGIGYNHLASLNGNVEKRASGFSENRLQVHTKYFAKKSVYSAHAYYNRKLVRNYGYLGAVEEFGNLSSTPTVDSAFTYDESLLLPSHLVGGALSLETIEGKKFSTTISLAPSYHQINDSLNATNIEGEILPIYKLKWGTLKIPILWSWNSHNSAEINVKRNLLGFSPTISHISDDERLLLEAGIKTNVSNDTALTKKVHLYPLIKGSYVLSNDKGLSISGELTGGADQYNLTDVYAQNPFIRRVNVASSNSKILIKSALNYSPLTNFGVKAFLNYSLIENFSFFTADTIDLSFYTPAYSSSPTTVITPGLELNYETKKGHKIEFRTQFNSFSNDTDQEFYFTPKSKTELSLNYKVNQKIRLNSDISYISGLVGFNPIENSDYELDNILDLNLKAEYRFNEKLGLFLYGNNLLNRNYEFYRFYTVNGINVLGGLTYSF